VVVFSSCTAAKDDSVPIERPRIEPSEYVGDSQLLRKLLETRKVILSWPEAKKGDRETYAFDLYVRKGQMYAAVYEHHYQRLRAALMDGIMNVEWFFISGGYGIVNALEPACAYQATLNKAIHYQKGVPFTAELWQPTLGNICKGVMSHHSESKIYVFGGRDYTSYFEGVPHPREMRIFKSAKTVGGRRLSPVLADFVSGLLRAELNPFDKAFPPGLLEWSDSEGKWVASGALR